MWSTLTHLGTQQVSKFSQSHTLHTTRGKLHTRCTRQHTHLVQKLASFSNQLATQIKAATTLHKASPISLAQPMNIQKHTKSSEAFHSSPFIHTQSHDPAEVTGPEPPFVVPGILLIHFEMGCDLSIMFCRFQRGTVLILSSNFCSPRFHTMQLATYQPPAFICRP